MCKHCDGTGLEKKNRASSTLSIPPGIDDGVMLRIAGEGEAVKGGRAGDLFVTVRVTPNRRFRRDGQDIHGEAKVSFAEAALGATKSVPTVDGEVEVKIPAGTQPGAVLPAQGQGRAEPAPPQGARRPPRGDRGSRFPANSRASRRSCWRKFGE